ncbi:MAG: mechanosensitive ion channel family protein [Bacteroidia bacterium]
MDELKKFFAYPLYGQDTVAELSWCIGILLAGLLLKRLLTRLLTHFLFQILKRYSGEAVGYNKLLQLVKKPLGYLVLLLTIYFASDQLSFPNSWHLASEDRFGIRMILNRTFHLLFIASLSFVILRIVDFFGLVLKYRSGMAETRDDHLVPFIKEAIKVLIIILSIFTILGSVFKINVASLIAGLGIGGLAVALAAKESIENLLGSFTIFLDKPFMVGDYVKISAFEGTVESIGFRSTRIRTVEKTLVTVPNKKMVDAELDNLSRRSQRRIRFTFGLEGRSNAEQIRTISKGIQEFMEKDPRILPENRYVTLLELGTNSVNMLVLCYIDNPDYANYLDVQQDLNYTILSLMEQHKVSFSTPVAGFVTHH